MANKSHTKSTDICIIGGGVIGKYLFSLFNHKADVELISSTNGFFQGSALYNPQKYLGKTDTWSEKATGIITYPTLEFIEKFPVLKRLSKRDIALLKQKLEIQNIQDALPNSVQNYNKKFEKTLKLSNLNYIDAVYDVKSTRSFQYQNGYFDYWQNKKKIWEFTNTQPTINGTVTRLHFKNGKAYLAEYLDQYGNVEKIFANTFLLANHTLGSILLINNSLLSAVTTMRRYQKLVGMHFSEHPQLSFGTIIKSHVMKRDLPPVLIYSDEKFKEIRYRIEINNTPPNYHQTLDSLKKKPDLTMRDYLNHFTRISVIGEIEPYPSTHLRIQGFTDYKTNRLNLDNFDNVMREKCHLIAYHVQNTHLANKDIIILNNHQNIKFSGHMYGGLSHKDLIDLNGLSLQFAKNVHVCSLAAFPSIELFNPTIPLLMTAQSIFNQYE